MKQNAPQGCAPRGDEVYASHTARARRMRKAHSFLISFLHIAAILTEFSQRPEQFPHYSDKEQIIMQVKQRRNEK